MTVRLRFVAPSSPTPGLVRLRFGVGAQSPDTVGTLAAALPAPELPPLTLAAEGDAAFVVRGALAATLPPADLSLTLAAGDRLPAMLGRLAAQLPAPALALTVAIAGTSVCTTTFAAALPPVVLAPLAVAAMAAQDLALITDAANALGMPLQHAEPAAAACTVPLQAMTCTAQPIGTAVRIAASLGAASAIGQQPMLALVGALAAGHAHGLPIGHTSRAAHAEMMRLRCALHTRLTRGLRRGAGTRTPHADMIRLRRALATPHAHSLPLEQSTRAGIRHGLSIAVRQPLHHKHGIYPPPGYWRPDPGPGPEPGEHLIRLRFCHLAEAAPGASVRLVFGCRGAGSGPVVIPVRSVYYVLNESSLVLAGTGAPIEHAGLALRLDIDSWAWGWSATVPTAYLSALRPDGADGFKEVIATINGESFRLLVETLSRERRFGRSELRIGGRSLSAWLASPHSPVVTRYNSEARTARQLLDEALTINGVPLGWTVDWQIDDWLVDAGAWSHSGSYIEAAVRIAETPGAVIQPHPTAQVLRVIPRYAGAPWEWPDMTPALSLPESVVTVEGITWADKPRYDAVYLAGAILGHVTRAGTSGGNVAPMVSDPLLTAPDATRQRGRAILSDTGRQAQIRLSLPVLAETGIIVPGRLIDYTESGKTHRGITRAVDVQTGFPAITQTITVETHELEPV